MDYSHLGVSLTENAKQKADSSKSGSGSARSALESAEKEHTTDKRNLAIDYLFALVLIEILKQVSHGTHVAVDSSIRFSVLSRVSNQIFCYDSYHIIPVMTI